MPLMSVEYYNGLDVPYLTSHSMQLLAMVLDAPIREGRVDIWSKEIYPGNGPARTVHFDEMARWQERYPTSKAFAIFMGIPSPTAREESRHAVALFINLEAGEIHYQDPHGLPMPKPVLEGLRAYYPAFTIYNHHAVQQPRGDLSCAAITIDNLVRFVEGHMPQQAPDIDFIRCRQLPHLVEIIDCENVGKAEEPEGAAEKKPSGKLKIKSVYVPSAEEIAARNDVFWAHPYPHTAPEKIEGPLHPPTVYAPRETPHSGAAPKRNAITHPSAKTERAP